MTPASIQYEVDLTGSELALNYCDDDVWVLSTYSMNL